MLPTLVLNYFSPHEMLYKIATNFNILKVFRSLCYASTLSKNRRKFDPMASKCVFIGFERGTRGYVLLNIQSREIFKVCFPEDQPILSQPSQVILAPFDNVENNSNNNY